MAKHWTLNTQTHKLDVEHTHTQCTLAQEAKSRSGKHKKGGRANREHERRLTKGQEEALLGKYKTEVARAVRAESKLKELEANSMPNGTEPNQSSLLDENTALSTQVDELQRRLGEMQSNSDRLMTRAEDAEVQLAKLRGENRRLAEGWSAETALRIRVEGDKEYWWLLCRDSGLTRQVRPGSGGGFKGVTPL